MVAQMVSPAIVTWWTPMLPVRVAHRQRGDVLPPERGGQFGLFFDFHAAFPDIAAAPKDHPFTGKHWRGGDAFETPHEHRHEGLFPSRQAAKGFGRVEILGLRMLLADGVVAGNQDRAFIPLPWRADHAADLELRRKRGECFRLSGVPQPQLGGSGNEKAFRVHLELHGCAVFIDRLRKLDRPRSLSFALSLKAQQGIAFPGDRPERLAIGGKRRLRCA